MNAFFNFLIYHLFATLLFVVCFVVEYEKCVKVNFNEDTRYQKFQYQLWNNCVESEEGAFIYRKIDLRKILNKNKFEKRSRRFDTS